MPLISDFWLVADCLSWFRYLLKITGHTFSFRCLRQTKILFRNKLYPLGFLSLLLPPTCRCFGGLPLPFNFQKVSNLLNCIVNNCQRQNTSFPLAPWSCASAPLRINSVSLSLSWYLVILLSSESSVLRSVWLLVQVTATVTHHSACPSASTQWAQFRSQGLRIVHRAPGGACWHRPVPAAALSPAFLLHFKIHQSLRLCRV